jgi:1-acyl-sn-glycerol-3-phosphate acyltransferase
MDGGMLPIQPGFIALARRAGVPIIPLGIAGAYDVWSRHYKFPTRSTVRIVVGETISSDDIKQCNDEELLARVNDRLQGCWRDASYQVSRELAMVPSCNDSPRTHYGPPPPPSASD